MAVLSHKLSGESRQKLSPIPPAMLLLNFHHADFTVLKPVFRSVECWAG